MKKLLGIMLAATLALPVLAETDANADYSDWLPKAGDWNIQIGMDPKAIVMGGNWSQVGGFSAGYMVTDNIGVKATLGLGVDLWNHREYALDDAKFAENPLSHQKVVDTRKSQKVEGSVSLGAEYHVGSKHKVQGVFGGGLMYGVRFLDKLEYTYGNAINEFNQNPSSKMMDKQGNTTVGLTNVMDGVTYARILNQQDLTAANDGPTQMVGLYLSAGLEWFVTPKLALGLNAAINFRYTFNNAYTTEYEGWSNFENKVVTWKEAVKPVEDGFSFSTADALDTKIYMSVYL